MYAQTIQHGFWYYNWGNAASVLGLGLSLVGIGFTIWTLKTAKSAERAAIEAKNSAAFQAFSNDARRAESHNRDIVLHMQGGRYSEAVFRSADLFQLLREMYESSPTEAKDSVKTALLSAKSECEQNDKLIRKINTEFETPGPREIQRIVNKANSIHASIVRVRIGILME
jgi:hypothetical protein